MSVERERERVGRERKRVGEWEKKKDKDRVGSR